MKMVNHIELGIHNYRHVDNNADLSITTYLIGNILPDVNCIYPAHRLNTTSKRFKRLVMAVDKTNNAILKSLLLGEINHYICDYFCYPHADNIVGRNHIKYELRMKFELATRIHKLSYSKRLRKLWKLAEVKAHKEVCREVAIDKTKERTEILISIIKQMYKHYLNDIDALDKKYGTDNIGTDIKYAVFMTRSVYNYIMRH